MSLAPLQMSVPASDGLILKGVLTYPTPRDSHAPLIADLLPAGVAVLAFDERGLGEELMGLLRDALGAR